METTNDSTKWVQIFDSEGNAIGVISEEADQLVQTTVDELLAKMRKILEKEISMSVAKARGTDAEN